MRIDQLTNLLAAVTVIEMMLTIGLAVQLRDVLSAARRWQTVSLALVANYVAVPFITVAILAWFDPDPMVAAGFLVAAVCPGAPYGPPLTAAARGNVMLAVGLMVLLAATSAIISPLLLQLLLPIFAGDRPLSVDAIKIIRTLLVVQLLPISVGLYIRYKRPVLADRLLKPATALSKLLNLALILAVLSVQLPMLARIRPTGYAGMILLIGASAAVGWLAGGARSDNRKALAIATSVRNVGVSLVIATASFSGTPAIAATTAFALVQTGFMALVAIAWGRYSGVQPVGPATIPKIAPR